MVADKRFPNKHKNVSMFRGSRTLFVYQRPEYAPVISYTPKIEKDAGGFVGFGSSKVVSEISFNQNQFYPGEEIKINIKTDNSKSKAAIRNYKFKLYRQLIFKDASNGENVTAETKLFAKKEPGVAGNSKKDQDYVFKIPEQIDFAKVEGLVDKVTSTGMKQFDKLKNAIKKDEDDDDKDSGLPKEPVQSSWLGSVFTINYILKVFVKVDNWSEFGEGEFVVMPVKIIARPKLEVANEPYRVPA